MRTPALFALIFFAGGIILATSTDFPSFIYLAAAVVATSLAVILYLVKQPTISRISIAIALFAAGGFLTELQSAEFPSNHISCLTNPDEKMTVTGEIVSEPDIRPTRTYLIVEVDSLQFHDRKISSCGRIRLQIQEATTIFNYRDRIRFTSYVTKPQTERNPGAFDYRRYLAIRQISAVAYIAHANQIALLESGETEPFIRKFVSPTRDYISSVFEKYLSLQQAAVMKGFLIGDVRYIPQDVYQRFKDTGTLHVLAASGANVGYVIATILLVIKPFRLPRQYRPILLIVGVVIFSFLAYNQPSVVRASVMATTALIGMALYRDNNWLNTISFAALAILAVRPLYIFDLGWQLSFAAAYALILFMPGFERFMPKKKGIVSKVFRYFLLIVYGSLVAQLGVLPILMYNFYSVPLVTFLSNLVVVPLVGVASTLGILLVFVSAIPYVAELFGVALAAVVDLTLTSIDFFKSLPIPPIQMAAPDLLLVIVYYLSLQLIFSFVTRRKLAALFVTLLLLSINTLIWKEVAASPTPELEITFLDTGRQSTILLEEKGGEKTLIDAGGIEGPFNRGEVTVLPFLRSKGIDHIDHYISTASDSSNAISLKTVISRLSQSLRVEAPDEVEADSLADYSAETKPVILISAGVHQVVFFNRPVAVQSLNNLPAKIDIAVIDWDLLPDLKLTEFLVSHQVMTVVVVNYPRRTSSTERIEALRHEQNSAKIFSVLESGGIVLKIGATGYRVLPTANK